MKFLHRWIGLIVGIWLLLQCLFGSILVWQNELDAALNPRWFAPIPGAVAAAPLETAVAVFEKNVPGKRIDMINAPEQVGAPLMFVVRENDVRTDHFVDPYNGRYLGSREWGAWKFDRAHVISWVYNMHHFLGMGETGETVLGIFAVCLVLMVISGVWRGVPRHSQHWKHVLVFRMSPYRRKNYYDLHRTVGLWVALPLLLLALTGGYMVFGKAIRKTIGVAQPKAVASVPFGPATADLDRLAGLAVAKYADARWTRITFPKKESDALMVRLARPESETSGSQSASRVYFDGASREVLDVDGMKAGGATAFDKWIFPVHSAEAFGLPVRLIWSVTGLAPLLFLFTGVWLWWQSRKLRKKGGAKVTPIRRQGPGPGP